MLKPIEGAPTSKAPRLAPSIRPGPPPVAMTLSRMLPFGCRAPPRSEARRPNARACAYQNPCRPNPLSRTRAEPNTTMVERTPHARSCSSALAYSSRKRTPRIESPRRRSGSSSGRRNDGEALWAAFGELALKLSILGASHSGVGSVFPIGLYWSGIRARERLRPASDPHADRRAPHLRVRVGREPSRSGSLLSAR